MVQGNFEADNFSDIAIETKQALLGQEIEELRRTQYVLSLRKKAAIASHNQAQLKAIEGEEARLMLVHDALLEEANGLAIKVPAVEVQG